MPKEVTEPGDGLAKLLAEGQAGFWLIECLLLALIEDGVVDRERIVEVIDTVIEAKRAAAKESADPEVPRRTAALLTNLANSLLAADISSGKAADPAADPDPAEDRTSRK